MAKISFPMICFLLLYTQDCEQIFKSCADKKKIVITRTARAQRAPRAVKNMVKTSENGGHFWSKCVFQKTTILRRIRKKQPDMRMVGSHYF